MDGRRGDSAWDQIIEATMVSRVEAASSAAPEEGGWSGRREASWGGEALVVGEWWAVPGYEGRGAKQTGTTANEHLHQMSAEPQTHPQLLHKHAFTPRPAVVLQHICSRQAKRCTHCTPARFKATMVPRPAAPRTLPYFCSAAAPSRRGSPLMYSRPSLNLK